MQTKPRFYLPELDGLRFIAFLLVFVHNANPILKGTFLEKFSEYSWFGVDLFFCLSGFLITKLLVTEHEQTGEINIRDFYIRRALRILPLYFFYIVIGTTIVVPLEGRTENLEWHLIGLATLTYNFTHVALLATSISTFIHLWSISFEAQFYVVIPWLVRKLYPLSTKKKLRIFLLLLFIGNTIRAVFINFESLQSWIYFLPLTRFDSILVGVLIGSGLLDEKLTRFRGRNLLISGILFLSLIFILPNIDNPSWELTLTYPLVGVGMGLLILSLTRNDNSVFKFLTSNTVVNWLGRISFGLYVFHFKVFTLTVFFLRNWLGTQQLLYPEHAPLVLAISLLMSIILATLSNVLLERPFLNFKNRSGILNN